MQCQHCSERSVFSDPAYCKTHFISYFEEKVRATIVEFDLCSEKDQIVVAASGGKDSLTVLYLMKKYFGPVTALAIDEGIAGYRSKTLADLSSFCEKHEIPLHTLSYQQEFGASLDLALQKIKVKPCTICGAFRRFLINKGARDLGATRLVTGHNLDDEAQAIFMNFLRGTPELLPRLGPVSGVFSDERFVSRIKPLYRCTQKEVFVYAFLQGFIWQHTECPYAKGAFRASVIELLDQCEEENKGTKKALIATFLSDLPTLRANAVTESSPLHTCKRCGEVSVQELCKACQFAVQL